MVAIDDSAQGELGLQGMPDLANQQKVKRSGKGPRDLKGYRHATPRQRQHHGAGIST
jgi:hypothetical protein